MARPKALLVGILVPGRDPASLDASLDELSRLCDTLGMDESGRLVQRRAGTGAAVILGEGKLRELAAWTGGTGVVHRGPKKTKADADDEDEPSDEVEAPPEPEDDAPGAAPAGHADVVVVDHDLSPSQLRNLKSAAGCEVLDRSGVIIEIFSQRARTREARLQVELARLQYLAPRLRELGGPSERQRGGIGGKGAGETALELDRRRIRDRIAEIRRELTELESTSGVRRSRRRDVRQVALVGYTNAGKSSLLRALTGAEPYVADQLFATLDTTVRKLHPECVPPVLVTDTVGFIADLPHDLVASFRSTLDAALEASLVLHVVDASDPSWREQEQVTAEVLADIGAAEVPRVLLFNKADRLDAAAVSALADERPHAWFTAAKDPARTRALRDRIVAWFGSKDPQFELFVPWSRSGLVGRIRTAATVEAEDYEDDGVRYRLRAPAEVERELREALSAE
jgi:GTP-binding protein HflX